MSTFYKAKVRASLGALVVGALVFEYVVYACCRSYLWPRVFKHEGQVRLLLVADPCLIPEPDFPSLKAFDLERYLRTTFQDALNHVQPHVVVFLGDLYATTPNMSTTLKERFAAVFSLQLDQWNSPLLSLPNVVKLVLLIGETDLGGPDFDRQGTRAVNHAFKTFFGNISAFRLKDIYDFFPVSVLAHEVRSQSFELLKRTSRKDTVSILLSHLPVLPMLNVKLNKTLGYVDPDVIFSAHETSSVIVRATKNDPSDIWSVMNPDLGSGSMERFLLGGEHYLELVVPSCSYLVTNFPGYGMAVFSGNKLLDYAVLWTPMRKLHLWGYIILVSYALLLITIPFGVVRSRLFKNIRFYRGCVRNNDY